MTAIEPILVIGGTRGTGLLIARCLCSRGRRVRVLARDPLAARANLDTSIEVVQGDLTKPETLDPALDGAAGVILTAGCRSGRIVPESRIKATEYEGVRNVLAAASRMAFGGRFLYMTASGATTRSVTAQLLNLYKGNTLRWRGQAEAAIRSSGLDYTIIRAGVLQNRGAGTRAILITQEPLPLSPRFRIARQDVAHAFVAALDSPRLSRSTFEIVWAKGRERAPWEALFAPIRPDADPVIESSGLI